MNTVIRLAATAALVCASSAALTAHDEEARDNKAVAERWYMSACGDLAEFIEYVRAHMAADGVYMPARYVGLGFTIDNDKGDSFGTILRVLAGSPAASALREGDRFVSVNGMPSTFENRDMTTFRGMPGETVRAAVMRDGEEVDVEITRGTIAGRNDKTTVLANLAVANPENWAADSCKVLEVVSEGDVVYTTGEFTYTESETGYPVTARSVERLKFNNEGKVVEGWNMREDRFELEQMGYSISR